MTEAYFYDASGHDKVITLTAKAIAKVGADQLIWIDLCRQDEPAVRKAATILGFEEAMVTSLLDHPPVPVLDSFEGYFQLALPVSPSSGKSNDCVIYVVAERWLLTLRDGPIPYFDSFREKDRGESLSGRLTPAALAAALLDWHLEDYQQDIAEIQTKVDKIDSEVLSEREREPPLAALAKLRTRVADLRRRLSTHRKIIHGLLRADFAHIAGHPHAAYYETLERHFDRADDGLDQAREMIVGSFELYATRTAQETNQLVKMLTLITVIIGLSSAIGGIFGMNFDTPLAKTGMVGFLAAVASMLLLAAGVFGFAHWRKWLR